jgi:hypothetical protein
MGISKVVSVLVFAVALAAIGTQAVRSDIFDPCLPTYRLHAASTPAPLFACPQGDTPSFIDQGWWIEVWVIGTGGQPIANVPSSDFWLIDCDPLNDITLCGGSASAHADSMTNAMGKTTLSLSTLIAGGCGDGASVVIQGVIPADSLTNCTTDLCVSVNTRSPDIDGNLMVDLVDLSLFAASYPPQPYEKCCDMSGDGTINLIDLSMFAFHFGPPGHACN